MSRQSALNRQVLTSLLAICLSATICYGQAPSRPAPGAKSKPSVRAGGGAERVDPAAKSPKPPTTMVTLDLITGPGASSLKAVEWSKIVEKLNVSCTIRRPGFEDEPGVTEKTLGTSVRQVRVTGKLNARGDLVFPDRVFTPGDARKLAEWIDDLKAYGAQGSPDGQKVWGLTQQQFGAVFELLATPLTVETLEMELDEILKQLVFSPQHPLKFTAGAMTKLRESNGPNRCTQSLTGVSMGTALAVMLAEHGLGMRPRRNPDGSVDLAVYDLKEVKDAWPVGWKRNRSPAETAPGLFDFKEIHFDGTELDSVLGAAAEVTRVPVLVDRPGLLAREIDLTTIPVDFPLKRTTWAQAYERILGKAGCKYE